MATNELPSGFSSLIDLADDMSDGLHNNGERIGVKQWTEAALTARRDAAKGAKKAHKDAGSSEDDVTGARKIANSNAKGFIATARRMLLDELGSTPNQDWQDAGWPSGSTAAPDTIGDRKKLLDKLVPWLGGHPEKEVAQKDFTAAKGQEILTALNTAMGGIPGKVGDRVKAAAASDVAERALRTAMSGLANELGSILPGDSADWYYFGLVPPANPAPPAPPQHLAAHAAGPTSIIAGCDRSPRGQKYLFAVQVVGRDAAPLDQAPLAEPQIILENLPAGATVRITATALNAAGQSATIGPVEVKLP